ncbi:hypothetical protein D3C80_1987890 [compost metagenome]
MARWFCTQDFWREHLQRTYPGRLALPRDKVSEKAAMRDRDDVVAMEAFNDWEATWLDQQRLALTEEAMARAALAWNIHLAE